MRTIILLCGLLLAVHAKPGYHKQHYQFKQSSALYQDNKLQHKDEEAGYYSKHEEEGGTPPQIQTNYQHVTYTPKDIDVEPGPEKPKVQTSGSRQSFSSSSSYSKVESDTKPHGFDSNPDYSKLHSVGFGKQYHDETEGSASHSYVSPGYRPGNYGSAIRPAYGTTISGSSSTGRSSSFGSGSSYGSRGTSSSHGGSSETGLGLGGSSGSSVLSGRPLPSDTISSVSTGSSGAAFGAGDSHYGGSYGSRPRGKYYGSRGTSYGSSYGTSYGTGYGAPSTNYGSNHASSHTAGASVNLGGKVEEQKIIDLMKLLQQKEKSSQHTLTNWEKEIYDHYQTSHANVQDSHDRMTDITLAQQNIDQLIRDLQSDRVIGNTATTHHLQGSSGSGQTSDSTSISQQNLNTGFGLSQPSEGIRPQGGSHNFEHQFGEHTNENLNKQHEDKIHHGGHDKLEIGSHGKDEGLTQQTQKIEFGGQHFQSTDDLTQQTQKLEFNDHHKDLSQQTVSIDWNKNDKIKDKDISVSQGHGTLVHTILEPIEVDLHKNEHVRGATNLNQGSTSFSHATSNNQNPVSLSQIVGKEDQKITNSGGIIIGQGTSSQGTSSQGTSSHGTSSHGTSNQGTFSHGTNYGHSTSYGSNQGTNYNRGTTSGQSWLTSGSIHTGREGYDRGTNDNQQILHVNRDNKDRHVSGDKISAQHTNRGDESPSGKTLVEIDNDEKVDEVAKKIFSNEKNYEHDDFTQQQQKVFNDDSQKFIKHEEEFGLSGHGHHHHQHGMSSSHQRNTHKYEQENQSQSSSTLIGHSGQYADNSQKQIVTAIGLNQHGTHHGYNTGPFILGHSQQNADTQKQVDIGSELSYNENQGINHGHHLVSGSLLLGSSDQHKDDTQKQIDIGAEFNHNSNQGVSHAHHSSSLISDHSKQHKDDTQKQVDFGAEMNQHGIHGLGHTHHSDSLLLGHSDQHKDDTQKQVDFGAEMNQHGIQGLGHTHHSDSLLLGHSDQHKDDTQKQVDFGAEINQHGIHGLDHTHHSDSLLLGHSDQHKDDTQKQVDFGAEMNQHGIQGLGHTHHSSAHLLGHSDQHKDDTQKQIDIGAELNQHSSQGIAHNHHSSSLLLGNSNQHKDDSQKQENFELEWDHNGKQGTGISQTSGSLTTNQSGQHKDDTQKQVGIGLEWDHRRQQTGHTHHSGSLVTDQHTDDSQKLVEIGLGSNHHEDHDCQHKEHHTHGHDHGHSNLELGLTGHGHGDLSQKQENLFGGKLIQHSSSSSSSSTSSSSSFSSSFSKSYTDSGKYSDQHELLDQHSEGNLRLLSQHPEEFEKFSDSNLQHENPAVVEEIKTTTVKPGFWKRVGDKAKNLADKVKVNLG